MLTAAAEGPRSREAYLALGVRQSIYAEADRPAAHEALAKYRAWLVEAGLYDPHDPAAADRLGLLRYLTQRGATVEQMVEAQSAKANWNTQ